jgi:hypothetical protein
MIRFLRNLFSKQDPEATLYRLSRKLSPKLVKLCQEMAQEGDDLVRALTCLAEIEKVVSHHRSLVVQQGWPHYYSYSLVGTGIHPVTNRNTDAEARNLVQALLKSSRSGRPRILDMVVVELAREEFNHEHAHGDLTPTLNEHDLARAAGDKQLFAFGQEEAITGQDLSYIGSGGPSCGGSIDEGARLLLGFYGRVVPAMV